MSLMREPKHLPISLPISMAVTAYGRIKLYEYKLLVGEENLLYSDTDSVFTSKPLDSKYLGPELGEMKLEYEASEGIFIAPKVYAIRNIICCDKKSFIGNDILKIKGSKKGNGLIFNDFFDLLCKNTTKVIRQLKFIRKLSLETIHTYRAIIQLKLTENKRAIIWHNNVFVDTKPYILKNNKKES